MLFPDDTIYAETVARSALKSSDGDGSPIVSRSIKRTGITRYRERERKVLFLHFSQRFERFSRYSTKFATTPHGQSPERYVDD